ncbi:hypothetical protein ABB37_05251 [Leptomonas pyrrhocoris]|uniref:Uncharacterized protein n=1 Tax=Leptomonas pyrrhocoris TaxID=157538 RepID=A0A0N0VEV1_LEPPY|nr:hypothetical protein ABB37_05251 [Leptomonas pyrrhocoris]KPA79402.1 hypothetical protein ABB37_05251 [Leptomonas pyrrhocoris]|eukprot:XP_015657841.1 hypothetical protein ABB37_05251 [Leptomonas pyrrhocoris]
MADAADSLLLTLEVEAAAARNAELSCTVEALQEEVQQLRGRSLPSVTSSPKQTVSNIPSAPVRPTPPPVDEPREVFLALDDLLFEVADIRSHLLSTTYVDLTSRTFDPDTTVTARALRCVAEVKKLKEALLVSQQSTNVQIMELRRALGDQIAANERQQAHFAVQRAMLERRCDDLQRQCDDVLAKQGEKVLNRVIQSPAVHNEKHEQRGDAGAGGPP